MDDCLQSSSSDGTDPSEDVTPAYAPASRTLNQEGVSAVAEEVFLNNEASSPSDEPTAGTPVIMNARAYQTEMFAQSMRQNIIVAPMEN
ncbi:uncharacterized protein ColSpa_10176 [Colletotrichum spaethianum]|uniref:Uncharacterized protein n=1 Tax=Colletotrichum spaethianum TaxID=700344 RepID=A0AA37UP54_9PEZI|nr:uncharacterized protein ColSpa_10176 [Colletotrichum spaethianum]GKT49995.1 hypothetical protein ColSpa_10176 [Colletotrichum spaethianum]